MNEMNKKPETEVKTEIPAVKPVTPTTSPINPQAIAQVKEAVKDFVNEGNPSTSTPATAQKI